MFTLRTYTYRIMKPTVTFSLRSESKILSIITANFKFLKNRLLKNGRIFPKNVLYLKNTVINILDLNLKSICFLFSRITKNYQNPVLQKVIYLSVNFIAFTQFSAAFLLTFETITLV